MREVWQTIFTSRGWEVSLAATAAEGLALLDPPPDYLILDLCLPDQGGEAVLRQVRDAGLRTRVAVTTAVQDPGLMTLVQSLRPDALFAKPVDVANVWREAS